MSHKFKMKLNDTSRGLQSFLGSNFVMIVDPSPNYRNSLKQFMLNLKIKNIRCVSSVKEARRAMITLPVGLLIVEWIGSEENGLQFHRNLAREKKNEMIPFLLLSGENQRQDIILASEVGVISYLLKPFSFETFIEKIAVLLNEVTNPNPTKQSLRRGFLAIDEEELIEARNFFYEALTLDPKSAKAYSGLAHVELKQQNYPLVINNLKKSLDLNPNFLEAHRLLLDVFEKTQNHSGMMEQAQLLHQESPENPKYTLILATLFLKNKELNKSESFFRKTMQLAPSLADSYKGLGHIAVERKNYEKADKFFQKALDLDQNDVSTLNSLGLTYINLGRFDDGLQKYRQALSLKPKDHRILFNIAQAYEKQENIKSAYEYYKRCLMEKPDFEKASRGLTRTKNID
ncbi:MAG: tetratricopeptide repeat protein [Oligoflexales bacterium]